MTIPLVFPLTMNEGSSGCLGCLLSLPASLPLPTTLLCNNTYGRLYYKYTVWTTGNEELRLATWVEKSVLCLVEPWDNYNHMWQLGCSLKRDLDSDSPTTKTVPDFWPSETMGVTNVCCFKLQTLGQLVIQQCLVGVLKQDPGVKLRGDVQVWKRFHEIMREGKTRECFMLEVRAFKLSGTRSSMLSITDEILLKTKEIVKNTVFDG